MPQEGGLEMLEDIKAQYPDGKAGFFLRPNYAKLFTEAEGERSRLLVVW